ncbi:arsenate reductase/protein-tyrosine-phosphatase family protein [Mangrovivirga cuniculi]|uniref:arsenate reductase/protein-tyrosine-phosphatase family protein n=1 Tax=Mangrovivirga cuniculi TaxID=2715131 RepID=UPI0021D05D06|nr:hypothetical protein [Mangrovivirga cuniculi]
MAEGIFRHLIINKGLDDEFEWDSAGVAGYHIGEKPDKRAISSAAKHDVELVSKGRQFRHADFDEFDVILAMDKSNYHHILALAGDNEKYRKKFI